jgi:hypothetical protein
MGNQGKGEVRAMHARASGSSQPVPAGLEAFAQRPGEMLRALFESPPEPLETLEAERARLWVLMKYIEEREVLAATARALWWHAQIPPLPPSLARFSAAR